MGQLELSAVSLDDLLQREWLLTNALGGYASSTAAGLNTRKYHGLLVAAMAPPVRRMVLLSRVEETVTCGGQAAALACNEYPGVIHPQGHRFLRSFEFDPFPRWVYAGADWRIEKTLRLLRGQNVVCLAYRVLSAPDAGDAAGRASAHQLLARSEGKTASVESPAVELELRPLLALRGIHELMYQWNAPLDAQMRSERQIRIPPSGRSPEVFFAHDGEFDAQPCWYLSTIYRREEERGYAGLEDLWMPGVLRWRLAAGDTASLVCSAEPVELDHVLREFTRQSVRTHAHPIGDGPNLPATDPPLHALLRVAEQLVVQTREETPAIISAYPWIAPSARDSLIALPGLLLVPGRLSEARALLLSLAATLKNGLMPSIMVENGSGWQYTAADTSLWFANAVHEYLRYEPGDLALARELLPALKQIVRDCRRGTALGVHADADGLLCTAAPGVPTTWMDARVNDWVITPRHGRPVEVNALWYNALRLVADLEERLGDAADAHELAQLADEVRVAFNRRFWNEREGCCFDVVEDHGSDPSIRPNQLLAISLPYPVLNVSLHPSVLEKVQTLLLTPFGVRTLAPGDPAYKGRCAGPPNQRDPALHNGSAHPWLMGPFISAYMRIHGRGAAARDQALAMLQPLLDYCQNTGRLGRLFDGDAPHAPGGTLLSALSVGEVLRAYVEDVLDRPPVGESVARVEPASERPARPVEREGVAEGQAKTR